MNATLLVAQREFTERLRDRTFLITNAVIIGIIAVSAVLPALLGGGGEPVRLGFVGPDAEALAQAADAQSPAFDVDLETEPLADRAAAEQALSDGDVQAALLSGSEVLVESELAPALDSLLRGAAASLSLSEALTEAGVPPAEVAALAQPPELTVQPVSEGDEFDFGPAFVVALLGIALLYGLLILYGQWVAQGVVEEKSSRVVEVLLSAVRPTQLLAGKILGLGALGFLQVLVLAAVGVGALLVTGAFELPRESFIAIALVVAWFVLGYALYATLFAVAGSIVNRVEDLQGTVMPIYVLIIGALFIAQFTAPNPDAPLSRIAGLVPFTAPLIQPMRAAAGAAAVWEIALAVVLTLLTIALLVPLAARLYSGGVLQTRRKIKLGEAWRAA